MAAKPRRRAAPPVQVNATVKEMPAPRHVDWFDRVRSVSMIALAITSVGTILAFSQRVLDSGPLPVPSRAEVQEVAKTVQEIRSSEEDVHRKLADQLADQHDITQSLIAQQKQELAASRTRQLRNLQLSLESAKATLSKDQSLANQTVVDTLTAQMEGLQTEIMREASK